MESNDSGGVAAKHGFFFRTALPLTMSPECFVTGLSAVFAARSQTISTLYLMDTSTSFR